MAEDIVSVIGQRVPLEKSGRFYKARCPFHEERTPSFIVRPRDQRFLCLGCGASGGVEEFLGRFEGGNGHGQ